MTQLPATFGRYLLVDKIATGGMAEIFKAKLIGVEGFEKTVVIKRILPFWSEREDFVRMLVDEAKILVHLNHPNIVQVYELGCEAGNYFIAMEYVDGIDLRHVVQRVQRQGKELPQELVIFILGQSLRGLQYAHRRALPGKGALEIVHRDISPQNILISEEGEVKVSDFGIAKALIQTHETQTGVLKGKYAYMSPEQATGRALDARSDIFACGVMLYELLMGTRLFAAKSDVETLDRVRKAEVPWPEERTARLFPGVREVISRALALDPKDRFGDAEAFYLSLEKCLPEGKRVGSRNLAGFFQEILRDEFQQRHIHELEVQNRTRSFLRQTKVAPIEEEDTVSLVSVETEKDFAPTEVSVRLPAVTMPSRRSYFGWILGGLVVVGLGTWGLWPRGATQVAQAPEGSTAVAVRPLVVAPSPSAPPAVATPMPTPRPSPKPAPLSEKTATLSLRVQPQSAFIAVSYPGGEKSGRGQLTLEGLPLGVKVKATAQLKDYDTENKTFQISEETLNSQYVFRLEKKPPKVPEFGSISVNAVPWGVVSMPGYISGSETPVSRSKIPEGSYRVSVRNTGFGKTVSATAVIRSGKTTRCHADFDGAGRMSCN